jgi:FSR family fosmidomycin resistance protein-like MFS transporter
MPVGLVLLATLQMVHRPSLQPLPRAETHIGLAEMVGERWPAAVLLLAVATLRVVPVLGVPLGLAFLLDERSASTIEIGWSQSLFLLSGGVGTLLSPLWTRPGRERAALVATVLAAAGCLALLAFGQAGTWYPGLVGSGILLQATIPILMAYSQKLLPRGQRLAASLTLGASWGLGGLIVAGLQALCATRGWATGMLWAMVPFALAAALGSYLLPQLPASSAGPVTVLASKNLTEMEGLSG